MQLANERTSWHRLQIVRATPVLLTIIVIAATAACTSAGGAPTTSSAGTPSSDRTSSATLATGGISGLLAAVGGPTPTPPRPLPGLVRITNVRSRVSRTVSVGTDGRFSLALPPGSYSLVGRSPRYHAGAGYDCQAIAVAVVVAGRTTSSHVYCQVR